MLPITNRLPKKQINVVFSSGQRVFSPEIIFYILKKSAFPSRFAVVVGKAVSPLATKRNRIKRLLRQGILRLTKDVLTPVDMVIVVKKLPTPLDQIGVNQLLRKGLRILS